MALTRERARINERAYRLRRKQRIATDPSYAEEYRKRRNQELRVWRAANPEYRRTPELRQKQAAQQAVHRAVARGVLVRQSCEECGETPTQAHHDDYSRPLDVRWLCSTHHGLVHRMEEE